MFIGDDPYAALQGAIELLVAIGAICMVCCVLIGRSRTKNRGRYASFSNLGSALQALQKIARPSIEHQLAEQRQVKVDEDDEGGPDDPGRYYRRLREKIDKASAEQKLKDD